ncbi:MAG: FtsX-like permease family protein [Anaerolineales bacterium]|nr:FtsX-like permease family protein [Anaerolineales bacterium]
MNTRWVKVWRDLWNNGSRTVLVILSIAVGVFAIGMIASTQWALNRSLASQYAALHPADAILKTEPGLDDDFVTRIRNMHEIEEAEGRRSLALRISLDGRGETWRDLNLYAIADFDDQRLFHVRQESDSWPPLKGQVLMERASMQYIGLSEGDGVLVKTPDGRKYTLTVAGQAHDLYRIPPVIEGWIYGYISLDTLHWMGETENYNELYIAVKGETEADIRQATDEVADRIESQGLPVYQKTLPDQGQHPLNYIIQTVLVLLGLLAALCLLLSAFLVINVVSALIVQQERQIGIMKAVGARSFQITGLYFGMVLILGLLACLIAIPLSQVGANALARFVAELINFNPPRVRCTFQSLLLQLGVGLLVPLLAAAPAIFNGSRVSPAVVLSEYGISQIWRGAGLVDRLVHHFPRLTRDTLLAIRNPFRKRGRLVLSLFTLTMAGAIFMAVVNLQASLDSALDDMLGLWKYDAWLLLDNYYPNERLTSKARAVPGVDQTETWCVSFGRHVRQDGSESANLYLLAPPVGTELIEPVLIAGRPLQPEDVNAILVPPALIESEPEIELGRQITIKIDGHEEEFTVVGVIQMMGNDTVGYMSYIPYQAYTRLVREPNRANALIFTTTAPDLETQRKIASQVEETYDRANIKVVSNFLIAEERKEIDSAFAVIVALLLIMTILLAVVGGLGLAGTMGLNVIERTREIGVMRAYGAKDRAIFRIVIIEGLLIGMLSWLLAIILSLPFSIMLARSIGQTFLSYAMPVSFSIAGILIWALLVIVISTAASYLPALKAVRLTVTQVLAYE